MSAPKQISALARVACLLAAIAQAPSSSGAEERESTPAVVNPVLRSPLRQTLSLDGFWDFATDASGIGEAEKWYNPEVTLPKRIPLVVPGCWEAQGVGGPGNSSSVTPERSIRPLRGSYCGTAWYRKAVTLPKDWVGKQVWLKVGGVHAQGWFWVNGKYIGHNACYCGTYKYNITDLVNPGQRVVIAAKVRNDVPSRKGLMAWIERFGGLYRSMELEATPSFLIDDACAVSDLDQHRAVIHVRVRAAAGERIPSSRAEVQVDTATLDRMPTGSGHAVVMLGSNSTVEVVVPVTLDPFNPWSPEAPNLYRADIVLKVDGQAIDGWVERFGVRKWEARGGAFYLNNSPYFIRGYGDDFIYPLTIVSPASREIHREHLRLARKYGFAYVRHHTHCELPEFYEAADEVGIMVQPELPYYGATPSAGDPNYFKPKDDLEELYTQYRRYVSLSTYCTGNEGHLGSPLDREIYQLAKRLDPTRLVLHQDGGQNRKDNSDFHQGPAVPWEPGSQDGSWPFTAHEYLNLATQEDPRLAEKYAGALQPPVTTEGFRAELARAGLTWEWGVATLEAGNQLQRVYQKRGLEQARLDPVCDGYIYWTIVDVGSPSAQGLLNQFWEPKASEAEYIRQFNGPTVVLAKFSPKEQILRAGDDLDVEWWISAFDPEPMKGQDLAWRLEKDGAVMLSGTMPSIDAGPGELKALGKIHCKAPETTKPAKCELVAELPGREVKNSWDLWIFPHRPRSAEFGKGLAASARLYPLLKERYPGLARADTNFDVWLTERFDTNAAAALQQGKKVLLVALPGMAPGVQLGWWAIGRQAGTAIARHPVFGDFPHEGFLSDLWFRLMGRGLGLTNPALHRVEPLMVTRGCAGYLLDVFEANAGKGRLLASGLNLVSDSPEAVYLLDQFIRYVRSPEYQPKGTLDLDRALNDLVPIATEINGWIQTVHASERLEYESFLGWSQMGIARQTDGLSEITWKTKPAPALLDPAKLYKFTWVAGLGYRSQPPGQFSLWVRGQPLLQFDVLHSNHTWQSPDGQVSLNYEVKSAGAEDSSGLMTLTIPGRLLTPSEGAQLWVRGSASNSRRWFGLYEINSADSIP